MANEAFASEAAVRRRLRWHEVSNSLVILFFALVIVAIAAIVVTRSEAWHRHRRTAAIRPAVVATPVAVKPIAKAAPQPETPPPPAADATRAADAAQRKPAAAPRASAAKPTKPELLRSPAPDMPKVAPVPPAPTVATEAPVEPAAMDRPSGPAAKQMLNSIKCFDQFEFDYRARGRQYFSALCKGGNRKQVSCAGAGCKIEYAPAPSHVPTGG